MRTLSGLGREALRALALVGALGMTGLCGALGLLAAVPGSAEAQPTTLQRQPEELVLHAVTFKYQPAVDGMTLIQRLLSPRGTVELQPRSNTLVIRDTTLALSRILPVLRAYDHAPLPVKVDVFVVRASRAPVSPPVQYSDLPEELTRRLRQLLPYDVYEMQAQAQLSTKEGQAVTYDLGEGYQISFRLGTLMEEGRVRLSDFQVGRRGDRAEGRAAQRLIHTNLNLVLEHPLSLGLARDEASREALMVVLTVHREDTGPIAGARP